MEPSTPLVEADDYFGYGADQFTSPQKLGPGFYISSENTINRGGIVQTRPGSTTLFRLPDGNLQGMTIFKPSSGIPHLVAAVDGYIYVSQYPFASYRVLPNIKFGTTSRFIAWASCLKTTDYDNAGKLYFLDKPYAVLIIQDGRTRAAYWDGSSHGHLNPTPSDVFTEGGEIITQPGYDETPVGLWMCWANNRLWVSNRNKIFASDIGNPTKFTERQYLNEARAFYLPDNCTGISPTTDLQGIVCFTEQTGTFLQSSIQDRTLWLTTPEFQKVILPSVGNVAPRSIFSQYGMLWWYSSRGLINQDDALRANITSRLSVQDNPMYGTKSNMSFDMSGICSAVFENMALISVPYGDKLNRRTMVLDQAPAGSNGATSNAWSSYWTGWRPVEWAYGVVNGEDRAFFCSVDYDGANRVWEAGDPSKKDNGVPITCSLTTREYLFGTRDYKNLSFVECELVSISGDLSFMISAAGVRGAWEVLGKKEIVATVGQIYGNERYGKNANLIAGSSAQTRVVKSQNYTNASECNGSGVESERACGLIDKAFSVMMSWSGICGIQALRIFARPDTNFYSGDCETNETGPRLLNDAGCGAMSKFLTTSPFTPYTSTKSYSTLDLATGQMVGKTVTATSIISQEDADRKAYLSAKAYVESILTPFFSE